MSAYANPQNEDLNQIGPAHMAALIRWFNKTSGPDAWGLSLAEQCSLLGGIPVRTFSAWKKKAVKQ